jgi:hypothetical protein
MAIALIRVETAPIADFHRSFNRDALKASAPPDRTNYENDIFRILFFLCHSRIRTGR